MDQEGYEPETVRIFNEVLKEGDSVIIAGAHQGYFVEYCAKLGCRVYGFEPEENNFKILEERVSKYPNVHIQNVALGDREVTAKLYYNSDNDGGHALWDVSLNTLNVKSKEAPIIQNVKVTTIDTIFPEGIDRLKLVLLDAEGSEHSILKGAINTIIDSEVPYIICEINDFALKHANTSQMLLRSYLSVYGYDAYMMNENKVVDVLKKDVKAVIPNTDTSIVFNMLFSRRGKI